MTKLEYVLSGKGEKRKRCVYAAFCFDMGITESTEAINNYYFEGFVSAYPFPSICIEIIKKEYGKRIDHLKPSFLRNLIEDMVLTQSDFDSEEIEEAINDFMES
jgi:hypothetical protein